MRWIYLKLCKTLFLLKTVMKKNVSIESGIGVKGLPILDLASGGEVHIGRNVTLNSSNRLYHINMHSPVKLYISSQEGKIRIGDNTRIHGSCLHARELIEVGKNCLVAANCQIIDSSGHDTFPEPRSERIHTMGKVKSIHIGDNVWIGAHSILLPGTNIGAGSVVAAGSVVRGTFGPDSLISGNPATLQKPKRPLDPQKSGQ